MCGRYSIFADDDNIELLTIIKQLNNESDFKTGEIFPTNNVPILVSENNNIAPQVMTWGFPHFKNNSVIINARSETASEKRTFKDALLFRRCLIPSTEFYEWSHSGQKIKYQFTLPNEKILYMAGLFNEYDNQRRFVILTTSANQSINDVHDRMPLIVPKSIITDWIHSNDFAMSYLRTIPPLLHKLPT